MFPTSPIQNVLNVNDADTIALGKGHMVLRPFDVLGSNLSDLFFGKNAIPMTLALWGSVFFSGVLAIYLRIPGKQVFVTYARRVIAMVQDVNSFRDRAASEYPSRSVGLNEKPSSAPFPDQSVAVFVGTARPHPTRSKLWSMLWHWSIFIHLGPKAFREGLRKALRGQIGGSNFNHLRSLCRLAYWAGGTFPLYQTVNQGGN